MSTDSLYHQVWLEEMERRLDEQQRRIYLEVAVEWIADELAKLMDNPNLPSWVCLTAEELRDYARGAKDRAQNFARPAGASA